MAIDAELRKRMDQEFERDLDAYMGDWEATLREQLDHVPPDDEPQEDDPAAE